MIFEENFAGNRIRYQFRYPDTDRYMAPYIVPSEDREHDILASEQYIESRRPYYPEDQEDSYVEYKSLIELTSRALLPHSSCLFHAVAFCWHGRAWLFSGPSGAGKTTQYKKWKITYRDDVQMICGDMPLLEWKDSGKIWVHPSPWNGKERIKGKVSAPLGGVILLEKKKTNSIGQVRPEEIAVQLFVQLGIHPETEEEIRQMADLTNRLLEHYPVWRLKNCGDYDSVKLAAETFVEYLD